MTRRVAIAIWILGLFVVGAPHPALAADYYIIRSGDMLYRVPHSAHRTFFDNGIANKKRDVVPHSTETRHKKKPNKAQKHSLPKQAQMIYVFAKVGDELHHLPCTYRGNGEVSYYGREFHGKPMKNGGIFNKNKLTAAYYDKQMVGKVLFIEVDKEGLQQRRYRGWRIDPEGAIALPITDTGSFKRKYGRNADVSQAAFVDLAGGEEKFAKIGILPARVYVCDPNPVDLTALE